MAAKFRSRLLLIIVCLLIIVQIFVVTSLKHEFEQQILAARQAVNEQTLLQSALVKLLVEKNVITREDLLQEAQAISRSAIREKPRLRSRPLTQPALPRLQQLPQVNNRPQQGRKKKHPEQSTCFSLLKKVVLSGNLPSGSSAAW